MKYFFPFDCSFVIKCSSENSTSKAWKDFSSLRVILCTKLAARHFIFLLLFSVPVFHKHHQNESQQNNALEANYFYLRNLFKFFMFRSVPVIQLLYYLSLHSEIATNKLFKLSSRVICILLEEWWKGETGISV